MPCRISVMESAETSNSKIVLCRIEDYHRKDVEKTNLKTDDGWESNFLSGTGNTL